MSRTHAGSGVLVSGSIVLDILVRPVEVPVWGGTARVETIEQHLGGNGANTAYAIARMGVPARLLGAVGTDPFGDSALAKLAQGGVDLTCVARAQAPTAASVVLVKPSGERAFLHRFGASAEAAIDAASLAQHLGFTHYHQGTPFAMPLLRPQLPGLLAAARAAGMTTSLDLHWDTLGRWMLDIAPCLPHTGILFLNETELARLETTPEGCLERGAGRVVLKLGPGGCRVRSRDDDFLAPGFVVDAVDTTGAGDTFAGAYLAALQLGRTHREAARLANAAGALCVQRTGAVEGLLTLPETEAWMRERS